MDSVLDLENQNRALPDPVALAAINLSCSDDYFFEAMAGKVKNAVISFQAFQNKIKNLNKNSLIKKINKLRTGSLLIDRKEIFSLEQDLNAITEKELRDKVANIKLFEGLNSEKPTPLFLGLARVRNTGSLHEIRQNDGTEFSAESDRNEFITGYYESLYKKTSFANEVTVGDIETFLGGDVLNSELVKNSK